MNSSIQIENGPKLLIVEGRDEEMFFEAALRDHLGLHRHPGHAHRRKDEADPEASKGLVKDLHFPAVPTLASRSETPILRSAPSRHGTGCERGHQGVPIDLLLVAARRPALSRRPTASSPSGRLAWASSSSRTESMTGCSKRSACCPWRRSPSSPAWTAISSASRGMASSRTICTRLAPMPGSRRGWNPISASARLLRLGTGPGIPMPSATSGRSSGPYRVWAYDDRSMLWERIPG